MLVIQILRRTTKEANLCHIKTYPLASLSNSQAISFVSCKIVETQGIQLETFKAGNYLFANLNRMACFDTFQVVEPQVCCNKLLQVQQSLMFLENRILQILKQEQTFLLLSNPNSLAQLCLLGTNATLIARCVCKKTIDILMPLRVYRQAFKNRNYFLSKYHLTIPTNLRLFKVFFLKYLIGTETTEYLVVRFKWSTNRL